MPTDTVTIHIICENPPTALAEFDGVEFGLQNKKQEIIVGETLGDGQLRFVCEMKVKQTDTGQPNFTGPLAQGTVKERFIYLSYRTLREGNWHWVRRIKVHLKTISWEQVKAAQSSPGAFLVAAVDGRGSASVPLLGDGWTVQVGEDSPK